jgi:uncharacterized protein DUF4340
MKGAWWLNALLAVAVAVLALAAYFGPGSKPAEHALATIKPAEVTSIRIERAGRQPIVLERKRDAWFMTAPLAARADPARVQRLLAITEAKSANRLAATDLARFELESPDARLAIGGQRFDFGVVSPVSREQYVLTGGAVYTVGLRYGAALPAVPTELIDRRLLGDGEVPVGIEVGNFTVSRHDGKWALDPPAGELSQDDLQRWTDAWRHASALRIEPYGGGKSSGEVRMQFQDGAKLTLLVLARKPELALARPDEKLVYYFFGEAGQRLLAPPAAK